MPPVMSRAPALTYLVLLVAAFAVGLFATIFASQALLARAQPLPTSSERPVKTNGVQLPVAAPALFTVEC